MKHWYNIHTGEVEADDDPDRSRLQTLMGPYESEDEAQRALDIAQHRTEQWDEEERRRRREDEGWTD